MSNKNFDHILGSQNTETTKEEKKLTKRILDAYIKEQPIKDVREIQRIGIKIEMKSYLTSDSKKIIVTGEFLNKLLEIYNIKNQNLQNILDMKMPTFML